MNRVKFWLGAVWASPVTLVTLLLYVLPLVAIRWYKLLGHTDSALVFVVRDDAPEWLKKKWSSWGGQTFGNIIVLNKAPEGTKYSVALMNHEMTHVRQYMVFGVFFLPLYVLFTLVGKVFQAMGHYDAYYDNPLEVHARRTAGQVVDVVGTVERLKAAKKS